MIDGLAYALIVLALALAAWALGAALADRSPGRAHLWGVGLLEVLIAAQLVVSVVLLATGTRPVSVATALGYVAVALAVPPLAVAWAFAEPTRWGTAVVGAGCLVVAVMVVRLQQVWAVPSA